MSKVKKIGYCVYSTEHERRETIKDLVEITQIQLYDIIADETEHMSELSKIIKSGQNTSPVCIVCLISTFDYILYTMGAKKFDLIYYMYSNNVGIYVFDHPELSTADSNGKLISANEIKKVIDNISIYSFHIENKAAVGRPLTAINEKFKIKYWEYQTKPEITFQVLAKSLDLSEKTLRKIIVRYYEDKPQYIADLNILAAQNPQLILQKRRGYPKEAPDELKLITGNLLNEAKKMRMVPSEGSDETLLLNKIIEDMESNESHVLWPIFKSLTEFINEEDEKTEGWIYYLREIPPLFSVSTSTDKYQRQLANNMFKEMYWQYKKGAISLDEFCTQLAKIKNVPSITKRWVYKKIHDYENSDQYILDKEKLSKG